MKLHTPEKPDGNSTDAEKSGLKIYLTHPINLPQTIAVLWLIGFSIAASLFPLTINKLNLNQFYLLFLVLPSFLFGLSGLVNITKGKTVGLFYINHGSYAYLDGIRKIIVGLGGIFAYFLYFFHKI